jgi:hypothetical protein
MENIVKAVINVLAALSRAIIILRNWALVDKGPEIEGIEQACKEAIEAVGEIAVEVARLELTGKVWAVFSDIPVGPREAEQIWKDQAKIIRGERADRIKAQTMAKNAEDRAAALLEKVAKQDTLISDMEAQNTQRNHDDARVTIRLRKMLGAPDARVNLTRTHLLNAVEQIEQRGVGPAPRENRDDTVDASAFAIRAMGRTMREGQADKVRTAEAIAPSFRFFDRMPIVSEGADMAFEYIPPRKPVVLSPVTNPDLLRLVGMTWGTVFGPSMNARMQYRQRVILALASLKMFKGRKWVEAEGLEQFMDNDRWLVPCECPNCQSLS